MKQSYFPGKGIWLKGNLHSHTTVSDGVCTPSDIVNAYEAKGYDFFSMTDHNIFFRHEGFPDSNMLLLNGVEHDLAYSRIKCIHVVGIGSSWEKKDTGYLCRKYAPDELTDQQLIDMMREDGQFVVLAHPIWSRMEPEEVASLKGFHAIEVYNHGAENLCHAGHSEVYWDILLRRGMRVLATASDDTHQLHDRFGGWVWVKAAEKSYDSVIKALFDGNFYASSGPVIYDFGIDGDAVYVECSECREIHVVTWPPRGKSFFAEDDAKLNGISYPLKGGEKYVRVECVDFNGRTAWTNPIFL